MMPELRTRSKPLLGTFVEISLPSNTPLQIFELAFNEIKVCEELFSNFIETSDISKINNSLNEVIEIHNYTKDLLKKSIKLYRDSKEIFNISCGGFLLNKKIIPNYSNSDRELISNLDKLILSGNSCKLLSPLYLSVNGIAKGYAVDLAVKVLKDNEVLTGLVNAGGDLKIFGEIQLPIRQRDFNGNIIDLGNFSNCAIATSRHENEKMINPSSFIIDPRKNTFESKEGLVTIAAKEAWLADALTKVALNYEFKDKVDFIKNLGGEIL